MLQLTLRSARVHSAARTRRHRAASRFRSCFSHQEKRMHQRPTHPRSRTLILAMVLSAPALTLAGGSNYTVKPGESNPAGKVREWPVPTPQFARDPAVAPDGNIYIAVMHGNRLARFDPKTEKFDEWTLP